MMAVEEVEECGKCSECGCDWYYWPESVSHNALSHDEEARWCSGQSSRLQPLRPPVRISGRALHVGKLVFTCQCSVVYSAVSTGFLHL